MHGLIYCISNDINTKMYIGQTTQGLEKRWNNHIKTAKSDVPHCLIHKAMLKYGIEHFKCYVVEDNIPIEILNDRERFWIEKYNSVTPNGYNIRSGGDDCGRKVVLKIDPNTNEVIEKFSSLLQAAYTSNIDPSSLSKVCIHKNGTNTAGGYKWSYEDNYDKNIIKKLKQHKQFQTLYQIDPYTKEVVNTWEGVVDASRNTKINQETISQCLSGNYRTAGNYCWCYADDYKQFYPKQKYRLVLQIDLNNNVVKAWKSAMEAAENLDINANGIRSCCRGVVKTYKKYIWRYCDYEEFSKHSKN